MQDFRNLQVWQKSHLLTLKIYRISLVFPKEELYGLTSQIRRASTSIPLNLSEGCGRGSDKDFARFVQMAMGSACEIEYLHILCHELGYIAKETADEHLEEIQQIKKMLVSLLKTLK